MKGVWGEHTARAYLERAGYRTVETNFRTRFGEIDIIAERGEYIVFVEVKTRKSDRFAAAREYVTSEKQHPTALQPRFDVVEVYGGEGTTSVPRINHLENAFGG